MTPKSTPPPPSARPLSARPPSARPPSARQASSTHVPSPAKRYHALHVGDELDVEAYAAAVTGHARVLEIGSGSGRISGELRHRGVDVVGVEIDPDHRALCAQLYPELPVLGADALRLNADDLPWPAIDAVLLPYSVLYCVGGVERVQSLLGLLRTLMAPGGRIYADGWAADEFHEDAETDDECPLPGHDEGIRALRRGRDARHASWSAPQTIARPSVDGSSYRVLERSLWWPSRQRVLVGYDWRDASATLARDFVLHDYLTAAQLLECVEQAGFTPCRLSTTAWRDGPQTPDRWWLTACVPST